MPESKYRHPLYNLLFWEALDGREPDEATAERAKDEWWKAERLRERNPSLPALPPRPQSIREMFRALDGWYGQSAQDYPVRIAPFAGWLKTQIDREANPAVDDLRKRNNLLDNPPQVQQYADDAKKAICTANELGLRHNVSFAKVAPAITWREKLGIFEQLLAACPAADAKPELSQIEFARLSGRSESWISKNRSKIGPFTVENARELREKNDGRKLRSQRSETDAEVEGKFKNTSRQ